MDQDVGLPCINMEKYERFRHDIGSGINMLLAKFLENLPGRIADIKTAIQDQAPESLARAAHKLKGTAATFGLDRLSDISKQLEMLARSGKLPVDDKLLDAIVAESQKVQVKLSQLQEEG